MIITLFRTLDSFLGVEKGPICTLGGVEPSPGQSFTLNAREIHLINPFSLPPYCEALCNLLQLAVASDVHWVSLLALLKVVVGRDPP